MNELLRTAPGGRIVSNYGTTTLVNNTQATRTLTVPAGRRWIVQGGKILNADSVARPCSVWVWDPTNALFCLYTMTSVGAGATQPWPVDVAGSAHPLLCVLPEAWTVVFTWSAGGASAGGTAQSTCVVLEVPA